ncbi:MAG: hypothetical protein Pars92KO_07200 [Parasphingorhabdus sp.]
MISVSDRFAPLAPAAQRRNIQSGAQMPQGFKRITVKPASHIRTIILPGTSRQNQNSSDQ